jgi:hypothetical protein
MGWTSTGGVLGARLTVRPHRISLNKNIAEMGLALRQNRAIINSVNVSGVL